MNLNAEVGLSLAVHSYVKPYDDKFLNRVEFGSLMASFIAASLSAARGGLGSTNCTEGSQATDRMEICKPQVHQFVGVGCGISLGRQGCRVLATGGQQVFCTFLLKLESWAVDETVPRLQL